MKRTTTLLALALIDSISLTGCVVAPSQVYAPQPGDDAYTQPIAPPPSVV